MPLLLVGLSHRQADLAVRERLVFAPESLLAAVEALKLQVGQCAILSTCNRTELYAFSEAPGFESSALFRFLSDWHRVPEEAFAPLAYQKSQADAVHHLFRVATGIDSLILGESEILGQVRDSYKAALSCKALGTPMARLFQKSLEVGKRARATTGIGRNAVSVSSVAVSLARETLGRLNAATVLVLGAGEMGRAAARALMSFGAQRLLVLTRDPQRARLAFRQIGGQVLPLAELPRALAQADVVITSAGSPSYLVDKGTLREALNGRVGRPLVIMDIAVPRNVEPSVAELPGIRLYNIDDLQAVSQANLALRQVEVETIEAMVEHEVRRFMAWWETLEVAPIIGALVGQAETIRQRELSRAFARLGPLSERDASTIDALSTAIMKKLLHAPIARLKRCDGSLDRQQLVPVVRELFRLDGG